MWESQAVFNAAAVYGDGLVHIVYRALGSDNISRLGYATSVDGFTINARFDSPIFKPPLRPLLRRQQLIRKVEEGR